jgi:glycosyltransferase involved in cell wall biosynthesis
MLKNAVVIIPTTGDPKAIDAINSVYKQTYRNVNPLVVFDGPTWPTKKILKHVNPDHHIVLPENTGADGFYGHRIYAAFSHLVNAEYVFFLDQDNWYHKDHVKSLIDTMESNSDIQWAYSLREIYDENGKYVCKDNCESLGKWPVAGHTDNFHIDTSCYAFKREFLIRVASLWHNGYGGDRIFYHMIRRNFGENTYDTNGKHTLCYRLDGNPNSVSKEFFDTLNPVYEKQYDNKFPWVK